MKTVTKIYDDLKGGEEVPEKEWPKWQQYDPNRVNNEGEMIPRYRVVEEVIDAAS